MALDFENVEAMDGAVFQKTYDYTDYAHRNHVNIIPKEDFRRLVADTFKVLTERLRDTYGPYGSTVMISTTTGDTVSTKDGFHAFQSMGFSHQYKNLVYKAIYKICARVNQNVGDGTTSCVLLAEKMFNNIRTCLKTTDDERNILSVLSDIEAELQNTDILEEHRNLGIIKPLDRKALGGLLQMSGNYDNKMTDVIEKALDPGVDDDGNITSLRDVVVESKLEYDGESYTTYEVDYLPGDYRVRVDWMGHQELGLKFQDKQSVRIALYDHKFGKGDWNLFRAEYDKVTPTIIMARDFSKDFLDIDYARTYLREREAVKENGVITVPVILCRLVGRYYQKEGGDLAAVLKTKMIDMSNIPVDHESLPCVPIQVWKDNCMCFWTDYVPEDYIALVKQEMINENTDSLIMKKDYFDRIRALEHKTNDTMITVKSGTSIEKKMIEDKIDDCTSIVESAHTFGIVPNSLVYGDFRINQIDTTSMSDPDLGEMVKKAIDKSIIELFYDLWRSKHGDEYPEKFTAISADMFSGEDMQSFDIRKETFVDVQDLPTSAQYDIEVIVAAISIVKYLLTSRSLIFDSHLLTPVQDNGVYTQI